MALFFAELFAENGKPSLKTLLIIFAKEPVPGQVKTRISPPLSPGDAARLYQVFLEDILEEIIGEFTTHSPLQTGALVKQEDGSVMAEGSLTLRDLNRKLGASFPLDGPKTLNGLILEHLEDIPEPGTTVKIADYPIEIVQTQDRAVKSARVYPKNMSN
jgi:Mg2+/Co2+ transporter CorB